MECLKITETYSGIFDEITEELATEVPENVHAEVQSFLSKGRSKGSRYCTRGKLLQNSTDRRLHRQVPVVLH